MPSEPRVVHVVDSLEIGGLERLVHDMAIARGSERTSVACLVSVGPFGEALRKQGIRVELIGTKNGLVPTVCRMWRHLRRAQPDVVHCHNFFAHLTGSLGARLAGGIPVVMTKHGAGIPGTGLGSRLNRFLVRRSDVVAVSREAMGIMNAWMPAGSRPVRCIANGISLAPYESLPSPEEARARLGLPAGAFIVGIVARVTGQKGHLLLIEVFARLREKLPGAMLLIVGDGAGLGAVQSRIHDLSVGESVLVMGARSDVAKILAAIDVFCLPSEMEGMPMTLLEAMAAGLPVVTSNVGGVPEVVEAGRTGLMVPAGAAEELEAALLSLASDPGRAREMGREGQQRLMREFSLGRTIGAYEVLYREALDRRTG